MNVVQGITVPDALEIVFEHRNKAYGAYQLRREYPAYLGRALGIGFLLICSTLGLPMLLSAVSEAFPVSEPESVRVEIGSPPEIEKPVVPPPVVPSTPPPAARPTMIFVPPVVVIDNQVTDEPPHTQEELFNSNAEITTIDSDGDPEAPPTTEPNPSDFGPVIEYKPAPQDETIHEPYAVQKMPSFGSGEKDLLEFLAKNITYPALARENNIQGVVVLSFVVDKEGNVKSVTPVQEIGGGCSKEAIRVVQSMPRWNPGEANGHPVNVRFVLPVRFKLN